jgi:hypothetical protein
MGDAALAASQVADAILRLVSRGSYDFEFEPEGPDRFHFRSITVSISAKPLDKIVVC